MIEEANATVAAVPAVNGTDTIVSKSKWAQRAVHRVTLPSGARVRIRIPDLSLLLAGDAVPDELRGVALEEFIGGVVGAGFQDVGVEQAVAKIRERLSDKSYLRSAAVFAGSAQLPQVRGVGGGGGHSSTPATRVTRGNGCPFPLRETCRPCRGTGAETGARRRRCSLARRRLYSSGWPRRRTGRRSPGLSSPARRCRRRRRTRGRWPS